MATRQQTRLSPSEARAVRLFVDGASIQEVADDLGVAYETARTFLRRSREKYRRDGRSASTRTELRESFYADRAR